MKIFLMKGFLTFSPGGTGIEESPKRAKLKEKEKKREYNESNLNIDHGSFSPLAFIAMGGMGRECKLFYNRLSELLANSKPTT